MTAETGETPHKAKVVLVDGQGDILVLTRSDDSKTRPGEPDLPGGKFDPGESHPYHVALRELDEELPDTVVDKDTLTYLHIEPKMKNGKESRSYVLGAIAVFPTGGPKLSAEHSGSAMVSREEFLGIPDMPEKYKVGVRENGLIIVELARLASANEVQRSEGLAA